MVHVEVEHSRELDQEILADELEELLDMLKVFNFADRGQA